MDRGRDDIAAAADRLRKVPDQVRVEDARCSFHPALVAEHIHRNTALAARHAVVIVTLPIFPARNLAQYLCHALDLILLEPLRVFPCRLVQLFYRHVPQFHVHIVYQYRRRAEFLLRDHALKHDRQIQKLHMGYVREQLLVFLRVDKLVHHTVLHTLIVQKAPHIHTLVDFVPVVCVHHIVDDVDKCRPAVRIVVIIVIQIYGRGNVAVILHHRQHDTVVLSHIIDPYPVIIARPSLHFFSHQRCKICKFHCHLHSFFFNLIICPLLHAVFFHTKKTTRKTYCKTIFPLPYYISVR